MDAIKASLVALIQEVIQGTPPGESVTWFVQGNEALTATLNGLTAAQASMRPGKANSIAAHVIHTTYYADLATDGLAGIERDSDWAGSWATQVVDEVEWTAARERLLSQVDRLMERIKVADLEGEDLTYALANLGHLAYHLGAIRQLYLLITRT